MSKAITTTRTTDGCHAFWLRKKAGFEDIVVTMNGAATGVTIVVDGTSNAIAFNASTAAAVKVLLEAATNAAATKYPIEARVGDTQRTLAYSTNYIIDDAVLTMADGVWYPLHLDMSNALQVGIRLEALAAPRKLLSVNGTFTGSGTQNLVLDIYEENPVTGSSNSIHTEIVDADAMTTKAVSKELASGNGINLAMGMDYVIVLARASNFSLANFGVNMQND